MAAPRASQEGRCNLRTPPCGARRRQARGTQKRARCTLRIPQGGEIWKACGPRKSARGNLRIPHFGGWVRTPRVPRKRARVNLRTPDVGRDGRPVSPAIGRGVICASPKVSGLRIGRAAYVARRGDRRPAGLAKGSRGICGFPHWGDSHFGRPTCVSMCGLRIPAGLVKGAGLFGGGDGDVRPQAHRTCGGNLPYFRESACILKMAELRPVFPRWRRGWGGRRIRK